MLLSACVDRRRAAAEHFQAKTSNSLSCANKVIASLESEHGGLQTRIQFGLKSKVRLAGKSTLSAAIFARSGMRCGCRWDDGRHLCFECSLLHEDLGAAVPRKSVLCRKQITELSML